MQPELYHLTTKVWSVLFNGFAIKVFVKVSMPDNGFCGQGPLLEQFSPEHDHRCPGECMVKGDKARAVMLGVRFALTRISLMRPGQKVQLLKGCKIDPNQMSLGSSEVIYFSAPDLSQCSQELTMFDAVRQFIREKFILNDLDCYDFSIKDLPLYPFDMSPGEFWKGSQFAVE